MKRYLEGIRFGLVVQLAVGPMCLLVFNTSKDYGFLMGMIVVLAIVLVDILYISLAGIGASKLLEKSNVNKVIRVIGCIVLFLIGLNIILSVFGIHLIPGISINTNVTNIFIESLLMALSNPITIIMWSGVLTSKIIADKLKNLDLVFFSCGLVTATFIFMTGSCILGTILSKFLPLFISNILNIIVGFVIIIMGFRLLLMEEK